MDFDTSAKLIIDTEEEISSVEDDADEFIPDEEEEDEEEEFLPATQLPEPRSQRRSQRGQLKK